MVIKLIFNGLLKRRKQAYLKRWREASIKDFYSIKLQSAATMVDKMSKFSRGFISLNSLSQIILKNRQRVLAKALIKWSKFGTKGNKAIKNELVIDLERKLKDKDQEL